MHQSDHNFLIYFEVFVLVMDRNLWIEFSFQKGAFLRKFFLEIPKTLILFLKSRFLRLLDTKPLAPVIAIWFYCRLISHGKNHTTIDFKWSCISLLHNMELC